MTRGSVAVGTHATVPEVCCNLQVRKRDRRFPQGGLPGEPGPEEMSHLGDLRCRSVKSWARSMRQGLPRTPLSESSLGWAFLRRHAINVSRKKKLPHRACLRASRGMCERTFIAHKMPPKSGVVCGFYHLTKFSLFLFLAINQHKARYELTAACSRG